MWERDEEEMVPTINERELPACYMCSKLNRGYCEVECSIGFQCGFKRAHYILGN